MSGFWCFDGGCVSGAPPDGGDNGGVDLGADHDLEPAGSGGAPGTGGMVQGGAGGTGGMDIDAAADLPTEAPAPPDWPVCTPPPNVDLDSGLVVYLQLDDVGTNPMITDSSANHLSTMVTGLPTAASWTAGRFGGALALSGGADGGWAAVGATLASEPALNMIINGLGLSVWTKFAPGTPPDGVLLSRRQSGAHGYLYRISVSGGKLRVELHTTNGTAADVSGNRALPIDGHWMHLGVSYDVTAATIELFVNGDSFGTFSFSLPFPAELTALLIGGEENATAAMPTTTIDRRLTGTLDEVAVYSRALTADQVKALACGARP